ncbi:hypothetical protein POF51_07730 [Brevibacillus sp. AG]|uniref:hypothetical protein n=1 Tax=Brevibacillus sp. AG TaxID=3020891 RepID=UPI00232FBC9E|nr:hypothetical protein [Brevibacillus sp. AG]MDC0760576.1 hypothetical protein [Brevibacillus sp. AG]
MRLKLNLQDNAYDFLNSSLFYFQYVENDIRKWKICFVNLVQALELMVKEKIRRSSHYLIFENIDKPKTTISLSLALDRMVNILEFPLDKKDIEIIKKAIRIRNAMMHFEVDESVYDLKSKYSILFEFMTSFHYKFFNEELHKHIDPDFWGVEAHLIEFFRNELVVYNNEEVHKSFPKEILEAQFIEDYLIGHEVYPRIRFGDEKYGGAKFDHDFTRCNDCSVLIGQYHVPGCDIEQCPKCYGQSISCICDDSYLDNLDDTE